MQRQTPLLPCHRTCMLHPLFHCLRYWELHCRLAVCIALLQMQDDSAARCQSTKATVYACLYTGLLLWWLDVQQ